MSAGNDTITDHQAKVLVALYAEHCETRRDVTTIMVCIAANAGTEASQRQVVAALVELRRLGLVVSSGEGRAWAPTVDGTQTARGIRSGAIKRRLAKSEKTPKPVEPSQVAPMAQPASPPARGQSTVPVVDLVERSAVMCAALLAQARTAPFTPDQLAELAWLQETGRMIEQAGGVHG